jgi:hypothetical protein
MATNVEKGNIIDLAIAPKNTEGGNKHHFMKFFDKPNKKYFEKVRK